MIYVCKTKHVKSGKIHIFRTVYDYQPGDIVYPCHLQTEYPGYNENRHKVVVCVPLHSLTREQERKLFPENASV